MRSFADVLAGLQGGIKPKPGTSRTFRKVPKKAVINAYGYVPRAVSGERTTMVFLDRDDESCDVTVFWHE